MALLIDQLGLAARIESGRYDPLPFDADTLELAASSGDERVAVEGTGAIVETDSVTVGRALAALAVAALRFGELSLRDLDGERPRADADAGRRRPPRRSSTAPMPRDLGALVARIAIERLGGSVTVEGESLRVRI